MRWKERKVSEEQTDGSCHQNTPHFLGSYAKNYQILLLWEGNGCHFETELPGTLLQSEAYLRQGFYLLNTEKPKEPLTIGENKKI